MNKYGINHTRCIRSEVINLSKAHNKKYTQMDNPKEQLRFAVTIGKDQCLLISQAKAYLRLIQYDYHSWALVTSHIPMADSCVLLKIEMWSND